MKLPVIDKIKHLMSTGETLSQRVARGAIWVFALRITREGLKLARLIILARLLAPNDFGLMGTALLAMSALDSLTETGFDWALIQKKGNVSGYLDTAWTVSGLRGLTLCVLLVVTAPYIAIFFNEPAAAPIVRVVGLSVLIKGWSNIGRVYFDKELEFNKKFIYEVGGGVADLAVAIGAVLILGSVWALVFGLLAGEITRFILSYVLHPYRPHLRLELSKARELFGFGKWLLVSSILIFLINDGDDLFLGRVLGVTALGFYQMAYRISNMPATQITHVISQVTFPLYSKLQDQLSKLREVYLKTLKLTSFLSFPIAAGIAVLAPDFTRLFLTDKWMPMVPAMQVLAVYGLIRSVSATSGPLFMSVGRPDIATKVQFGRFLVMAACIYPLTVQWDIIGTALAVLISITVVDTVTLYLAGRISGNRTLAIVRVLIFPLLNASIMTLLVLALKSYVFSTVGMATFFLLIAFGVFIYFVIAYIFDRWLGYNIASVIKDQFKAL